MDDDPALADALSRALKRWHHDVTIVGTGHAAADLTVTRHFDLILLDLFLPDGRGYEWIPLFKRQYPEQHIITMTGYNTPEMEKKIRTYGITYYLAKPVIQNELKTIIDHLSKKQQQEKRHAPQDRSTFRPASKR